MFGLNCRCNNGCSVLTAIASIVIGVIVTLLTITAQITITDTFLWVTFGIGVVYLALTFVTSTAARCISVRECLCTILPVLLTGILGTILASVILLGITFAATSTIGAIIAGALGFFFSLMIGETACLAACSFGCQDN